MGVCPIGRNRRSELAVLFTEASRNQDKVKDIHDAVTVDISVQILSALTELTCDGH